MFLHFGFRLPLLCHCRAGLTVSTVPGGTKQTFIMEQLNRIELRGNVGTIKVQGVNGTHVGRISLATNYVYKDKEGNPVIETTWHNITAWEGKNISELGRIHRGDKIYVVGRVRSQRYEGSDGTEKTINEVVANRLNLIESDESLAYEL